MAFETIFQKLLIQIRDSAELMHEKYREEAIADGQAFLHEIREDLWKWTQLLMKNEINYAEFRAVVIKLSEKANVISLLSKGLGISAVGSYKENLARSIVHTVVDNIKLCQEALM
ncbi:MAG: hypothetical protein ACM3WV_04485 [Bacillota bacterium]